MAPCRELDRVHVQGQAEAGADEQAVERVDGAMVEVMRADLLHPPRADARKREDSSLALQRRHGCRMASASSLLLATSASPRLLADEHRGARLLGMELRSGGGSVEAGNG